MSSLPLAVEIMQFDGNDDLPLPSYATEQSVGLDLPAAVDSSVILSKEGGTALIPCGFAISIPHGYEGQIRPRSGWALKHSVTVANAPGTIDPDYRGEVKVILINHGKKDVRIERGDRIGQFLVVPVPKIEWKQVSKLSSTVRDTEGFGHTGN